MAEPVKLFGVWASPFSWRVETALKLKGVKYEFIEEDLANKSDLLVKYNPVHKKIPVLLHKGKPICESLVILEYIDETWKGISILPEDPYERAIARFWAKFIDEKCNHALWTACWSKDNEQEKAVEEACELLKTLETQLKGNKFFGGETIGFVDFVANFIGFWLGIIQEAVGLELLTEEKFPNLCKWIDNYVNCPVIKANLPPRDQLLAYFKAFQQPPTGPKY
ncbi:Glutathione S-transferase [Actinidia chinensis var. chinensis]|uniref:Probable glutathione S-transferase n=1 Tax=Actinidia chinensis var. chinensis TaxID=1590841 RepID=A0A2R6RX45_ACTCC|nr:Glutathione S-transferase [Actinidia chinensis var. chinensis]